MSKIDALSKEFSRVKYVPPKAEDGEADAALLKEWQSFEGANEKVGRTKNT